MKQFNHLRKELRIRNNKHGSTVELDNINVRLPRKKAGLFSTSDTNDNRAKIKFKLPEINK